VELVSPPIPRRPADVFRIEAWVFIPDQIGRTRRGLIVSPGLGAGTYSEARRFKAQPTWQHVVLYREVIDTRAAPATFRVHIGLCGQGGAYVDEVSVRRLAGRP